MTSIFVRGIGAVSPAGWGVPAMRDALERGRPLSASELTSAGSNRALSTHPVPPPDSRPAFLAHPRLRRASPITHYAVAAALEAVGQVAGGSTPSLPAEGGRGQGEEGGLAQALPLSALVPHGEKEKSAAVSGCAAGSVPEASRLGIILCVMTGCVNYSRRFYDETLKDPATASPLIFPETVFNAPASHLATVLGTTALNYTLVGDPGTFVQGLALGADWLLTGRVTECLVIGAEELDWLTADGNQIFSRQSIMSAGAGAVLLTNRNSDVILKSVTDSQPFFDKDSRALAARRVRDQLPQAEENHLLCDSLQGIRSADAAELAAWRDWPASRLSPKIVLGEGLAAASAWQCVAAVDALRRAQCNVATISVLGCNEQAIGASFRRVN